MAWVPPERAAPRICDPLWSLLPHQGQGFARVAHSFSAIGFVGDSRARLRDAPPRAVAPPSGGLGGLTPIIASALITVRCRAMEHQRKKLTASAHFVSLYLARRVRQPCRWKRMIFLCLALLVCAGFLRSVFCASHCVADGSGLAVVVSRVTRCTRMDTPSQELVISKDCHCSLRKTR